MILMLQCHQLYASEEESSSTSTVWQKLKNVQRTISGTSDLRFAAPESFWTLLSSEFIASAIYHWYYAVPYPEQLVLGDDKKSFIKNPWKEMEHLSRKGQCSYGYNFGPDSGGPPSEAPEDRQRYNEMLAVDREILVLKPEACFPFSLNEAKSLRFRLMLQVSEPSLCRPKLVRKRFGFIVDSFKSKKEKHMRNHVTGSEQSDEIGIYRVFDVEGVHPGEYVLYLPRYQLKVKGGKGSKKKGEEGRGEEKTEAGMLLQERVTEPLQDQRLPNSGSETLPRLENGRGEEKTEAGMLLLLDQERVTEPLQDQQLPNSGSETLLRLENGPPLLLLENGPPTRRKLAEEEEEEEEEAKPKHMFDVLFHEDGLVHDHSKPECTYYFEYNSYREEKASSQEAPKHTASPYQLAVNWYSGDDKECDAYL